MAITCLEDQLRRDENERQYAYDDANGKTVIKGTTLQGNLTIGVGRNLSAKGLSQKEREFLLANDIADATAAIDAAFPWTADLGEVRKGVVLNMAFNMGVRGVDAFHVFLAQLRAGDFSGAEASMLDSLWAKQIGLRAQRLALQIGTGFWQ